MVIILKTAAFILGIIGSIFSIASEVYWAISICIALAFIVFELAVLIEKHDR